MFPHSEYEFTLMECRGWWRVQAVQPHQPRYAKWRSYLESKQGTITESEKSERERRFDLALPFFILGTGPPGWL